MLFADEINGMLGCKSSKSKGHGFILKKSAMYPLVELDIIHKWALIHKW